MRLLQLIAAVLVFLSAGASGQNATSLCGEQLSHHSGFLNELYYVLFESTSTAPQQDIPLVLWLSGGPGCSGLVAALFELGPCTFDDEANELFKNGYSWTNVAHVIFVDQPHGTGFSEPFRNPTEWTERRAMHDLAGFVDEFFRTHPSLRGNDFYVFGESYGGHYAPDLAATLIHKDASWRMRLKGVGIGNGVVSPIANLETYMDFATGNKYADDIVGVLEGEMRKQQQLALGLAKECQSSFKTAKTSKRMRALALELDDDDTSYPQVCRDAADAVSNFTQLSLMGVMGAGRNMYDLRRVCHSSDPKSMCYYFTRFEDFVNAHALEYLGLPGHQWSLCSADVSATFPAVEFLEESEENVALVLNSGVRVLVYVGDADAMAPWNMQDRWTHDLQWSGSVTFNQKPMNDLTLDGDHVGMVRSAGGLSLVRVFNSGHMVPRDQPKLALEMLKRFTRRHKNDHSVFS